MIIVTTEDLREKKALLSFLSFRNLVVYHIYGFPCFPRGPIFRKTKNQINQQTKTKPTKKPHQKNQKKARHRVPAELVEAMNIYCFWGFFNHSLVCHFQ